MNVTAILTSKKTYSALTCDTCVVLVNKELRSGATLL